ncbi:MAG TPA: A/G-specific adenine glycosylase [Bryobacteraceae bacterium]|nr:A/G-specific adenine glycosylase [Bryobacteraceae bacterium]
MDARAIRNALVRWYESAKRDLPWRRTRDPYAIWISEIMLQQTRVAAVIPYYERFLAAFPNATELARAAEDQVLTMWSGLGYYSRARNLQKAAGQMGATFPRDYESIRALAGVGEYTAAAVASIAFGLPHAAVDGNVRRVIVRLTNDDAADVARRAAELLDRRDPGRWNQALMELGATVCLPRDPLCGSCPIAFQCQAHRHGTQSELPSKRKKPEPLRLTRTLLMVRGKGRVLLTPSSRVQGFWDLPEAEQVTSCRPGALVGEFRHTITHRQYRFMVRRAKVTRFSKPLRWFADEQLDEIPLSTTAKKALRCLQEVDA